MKTVCWVCAAVLWFALMPPLARALDVTLDGGGGPFPITDNDGNDLNPATGVIDFDLTVGALDADARVLEQLGPLRNRVTITSRTIGGEGVFQNLDSAAHAFVVTVNSTPFAAVGIPLGWRLFYSGSADDPSIADVDIPTNDVTLSTDGPTVRASVSAPVPLTDSGSQPVLFDEFSRASDATGQTTTLQLVWNLSAGPGDEIRLPDNNEFEGVAIHGAVFNQIDDCILTMNRRSRQAVAAGGNRDMRCIAPVVRTGGGDVTACVDNPVEPRSVSVEEITIDRYPLVCPIEPAFGVNQGSCCHLGTTPGNECTDDGECGGGTCAQGACITAAGEQAANGEVHELFGPTVSVSGTLINAKCQKAVAQKAYALLKTRWQVFTNCKLNNLTTLPIDDEAGLVSTCLGPPQPDPDGYIATRTAGLATAVQNACVNKGVTPVGAAFPGACTGEADGTFADCVGRHAACRFCRGIQAADDLGSAVDCDLFDNGSADSSCP